MSIINLLNFKFLLWAFGNGTHWQAKGNFFSCAVVWGIWIWNRELSEDFESGIFTQHVQGFNAEPEDSNASQRHCINPINAGQLSSLWLDVRQDRVTNKCFFGWLDFECWTYSAWIFGWEIRTFWPPQIKNVLAFRRGISMNKFQANQRSMR